MKNKILVAAFAALCAFGAYNARASEPTPCEAASKICEVPVYEPAPCAPVETSIELPEPEPCAPVALPSCNAAEEQSVFCRSRKKVRQKTVSKKKRCFLTSLKENYEQRVSARAANKSFSFSFCREVKIETSN